MVVKMKKVSVFFLFIVGMMVLISACGGGGGAKDPLDPPTETTLTGQVITQDGQRLANMSVAIGSHKVITDSSGNFQIENFMTGTYEVSVRGISGDNLYLYGPAAMVISKDGILNITAYKMNGFGVIAAPYSSDEGTYASLNLNNNADNSIKSISWDDFKRKNNHNNQKTPTMSLLNFEGFTAAASQEFLRDNNSFFALIWEPVQGASKYQIKYKVEVIWNSDKEPGKYKEPYSASEPKAFLDLSAELAGKNINAGVHDFQLICIKNNESKIMATIPLYIGQYLSDYPTELKRVEGKNQISWRGVDGAHNYLVKIYADDKFTNQQWSSNLIDAGNNQQVYSVTFQGSSLKDTEDDHYHFTVDARYCDEDGFPLELTRNNSGFRY